MFAKRLKRLAAVAVLQGALTLAVLAGGAANVFADDLLDPMTQPKFVNPLPIAARWDLTAGGSVEVSISQFEQHLGLYDPVTHAPLMTTVWGYNGGYPGPTIVAQRYVPLDVLWKNELVDEGGVPLPHLLPVDTSIHWAMPMGDGVPVVTHLHGGHSESASDGLPLAWFTPGFAETGEWWVKPTLHYDNDQEGATLWYHDHALGITRLNVYAGLAGFYLLRDANEDALVAANQLPTGPYEIEMAIQDRMFTEDGELYYPSEPEEEGQPEPSVLPEFFGDFILVNSKAWPILEVEPRQYRFRLLNGSDSRFYNMRPVEVDLYGTGQIPLRPLAPPMYQIGTDDGLLDAPVPRDRLLIGPGERLDVVMDFSDPDFWGKVFVMKNNARSPFPMGEVVDPQTTGQIMAFYVNRPFDPDYPATTLPADLRPVHGPIDPLTQTGATRELVLFEGTDEYGRLMPMLGTVADGAMHFSDAVTENPMMNDVEVWEIYNGTEDAHPIHLHLVSFLLLDRQKFKATQNPENGALSNIKVIGKPTAPGPEEQGRKDTVIMYPGQVTRVIAMFDREGFYVWHCHILSHEDHDMMRPYYVGPMALQSASESHGGAAATSAPVLEQNYPNPFNPSTDIRFAVPAAGFVELRVYNAAGQEVRTLASRVFASGSHVATWDGRDNGGRGVASGVYFYELRAGATRQVRKMVMIR